jgi:tetratricopeptide (TPR) repeat protein
MRVVCSLFGFWLMLTSLGMCMSEANRESLEKYFAGQGEVRYAVYAPLGGPEVGVAQIGSGPSAKLQAVRMPKPGTFETLYTETIQDNGERAPFTLMLQGRHLMVYSGTQWSSSSGGSHRRGDLVIRDLTGPSGSAKTLFELKDVVDLQFSPGTRDGEGLIWQALPHFLNDGTSLPIRHQYFRLVWDEYGQTYQLRQHLTPMAEAAVIPEANLNNRAIIYYRAGQLRKAHALLSQAVQEAEEGQSLIMHNNQMVDGEIDELSMQGRHHPGRPFDEALQYFWQGDFEACLRVLETRKYGGFNDRDMAMLSLALAQERRWREVDSYVAELARRQPAFIADFVGELVMIAQDQGHRDTLLKYVKLLEQIDNSHPASILAKANLYLKLGDLEEGRRLLEHGVRSASGGSSDLSPLRLALYQLYSETGNGSGMQDLIADASDGPVTNLRGLVDLIDHMDLRSALVDIVPEEGEGIPMPNQPLDSAAAGYLERQP